MAHHAIERNKHLIDAARSVAAKTERLEAPYQHIIAELADALEASESEMRRVCDKLAETRAEVTRVEKQRDEIMHQRNERDIDIRKLRAEISRMEKQRDEMLIDQLREAARAHDEALGLAGKAENERLGAVIRLHAAESENRRRRLRLRRQVVAINENGVASAMDAEQPQTPTEGAEEASVSVIDAMAARVHKNAVDKGFWEDARNDGEMLMLMVSELAEALEALRDGNPADKHIPELDSFTVELSDCVIRILDIAAARKLPLARAILAKMKFNESRPRKHGKAF